MTNPAALIQGLGSDAAREPEVVTAATVMQELHAAARGLEKGATRLFTLTRDYEGGVDDHGEYQPGPQLKWLEAVGNALDDISQGYEDAGKRAPAEGILQRRAERRAKQTHPDLYADYHRLRSEIQAMEKWLRAKRETIGARQSWLKAELALTEIR